MGPGIGIPGKRCRRSRRRARRPASMGPGIGIPGKRPSRLPSSGSADTLQWGPGLVSRERRRTATPATRPTTWASMGPGIGIPGKGAIRSPGASATVRFNGARDWYPGKGVLSPDEAASMTALQWGPGLVSRERSQTRCARGCRCSFNGARDWYPGKGERPVGGVVGRVGASMGPGIGIPGKDLDAAREWVEMWLQWGPGLVSRERAPR